MSKADTLKGFLDRADAIREDAMARFDRIAAAGAPVKLSALQIDIGRVASAAPEAGR